VERPVRNGRSFYLTKRATIEVREVSARAQNSS